MVISGPLVSPILIGRTDEVSLLSASADAARNGNGGLVLLAGEAGIGKSRLVSEVLTTPTFAEFRAIRVACLESDLSEPYALVREIAHAAGDRRFKFMDDRAPEAERQNRRIQHALHSLLMPEGAPESLILIAEDLHWCDSASLNVFLGIIQRPGTLFILATYRHDEVTPDLAGFLAQTHRIRNTREILLDTLDRTDVARMIQTVLGLDTPVPGALLEDVMFATDGNPFLVEEVLGAWQEEGALEQVGSGWRFRPEGPARAPRSIQRAIDARLRRQPSHVVRTAEIAAVVGERVDFEFLQQLSNLDEQLLAEALRRLSELHILIPQRDGSLAFRHALTRQALLSRMVDPERRSLHRRVAELLEAEAGNAPGPIAYQWAQAGDAARAAPHARRAAEHAASLHAHREAIRQYELALTGEKNPQPELLSALGDHHSALGESPAALDRYQMAQDHYAASGESGRVAQLELRIGLALAHDRQRVEAIEHLETAFRSPAVGHHDRWSAGLHLALQIAGMGRYEDAESTLDNTLAVTDPSDILGRLRLRYEKSGLRALRGDWHALDSVANEVLQSTSDEDDTSLALRNDAHSALGSVSYYRGEFEQSASHFKACMRIAEQRGLVNEQAMAHWNLATNAYYNLGRWTEARAELAKLQALGALMIAESGRWVECWLDGEWEQAAGMWARAWPELVGTGDLEAQTAHGRRFADVLLALGKPHEALEVLTPVLEQIRDVQARSFEAQLVPREAEALARTGDERALEVCDAGLELADELGARPCEGLLLRARALACRTRGSWADAFRDSEAAIGILNDLPMPYECARAWREAGLIRLARGRRGDRERAARALRRGERIFADLGATRDEAVIAGILSAAGLAGPSERGQGPLTAREREVAQLVAEGLSNRDIAERLYITEKTAAYHVSRILNKLEFDSRSQIAAYVTRQSTPPQTVAP